MGNGVFKYSQKSIDEHTEQVIEVPLIGNVALVLNTRRILMLHSNVLRHFHRNNNIASFHVYISVVSEISYLDNI